jgi:hypothetical protein
MKKRSDLRGSKVIGVVMLTLIVVMVVVALAV